MIILHKNKVKLFSVRIINLIFNQRTIAVLLECAKAQSFNRRANRVSKEIKKIMTVTDTFPIIWKWQIRH